MTARAVCLLMLLCITPLSAMAQVSVFAGASATSRVGDGTVNVWTTGAQVTVAPSDRGAFSFVANFILGDKDDDPSTEMTGSHLLTTFRLAPFRRFWYLGAGMVILHERFRITRQFSITEVNNEYLGFVWFSGIDLPVRRLRPFAEIRSYNIPGMNANQRVYAFGLDVRIN